MKGWNLQKSGFIWVPQLIVIGKRVVFIVAHMVKNANWPEANQLAIYKGVWEVDSGLPRTSPAFPFGWGPIDYNSSFAVLSHAAFASYVIIILPCMMLKFLLRI